MGDSDTERDAGSDMEDDDGAQGFDPAADMANMSEKERKKWEKNAQTWRVFIDFLFRQVTIATFKYNSFEREEMLKFMIALEAAETTRGRMKLKKGETARITSYKTMHDSADLLTQHNELNKANTIYHFLDICGRMKGISMIAAGFFKTLKKGKVRGLDKIKYYLDYWKGFCLRSFDYGELQFRNASPEMFNELEAKYMVWTTSIRTSLNLAQKFLKKCSESTGLSLMNDDHNVHIQHMQAAEYVVARKINDLLFQKIEAESKTFLSASQILGGGSARASAASKDKWQMPDLSNIDHGLLSPIPDTSILLSLPLEPPKEKKGGKKKGGKRKKSTGGKKSKKKK